MNNKKDCAKGFIAGVLLTILLSSTITILANTGTMLEVFFNVNHVIVNGTPLNLSEADRPFISDGRTFLPVRAISEALGQPIDWDGNTGTVYIGSPAATAQQPTDAIIQPAPTINYQLAADFLGQMTTIFTGVASGWGEWGENLRFNPPGNRTWDSISIPLNSVNDVPHIFWNSNWEQPELHGFFDRHGNRITEAPYINGIDVATNFRLYDIDNDGIPEILIHWDQFVANGAYPFSLFRYVNGQYREMEFVSAENDDTDDFRGLHLPMLLGQMHRFYTDSHGRLVLYGVSGGGGGIESIGFLTFHGEEARFELIESWFSGDAPPEKYNSLILVPRLSNLELQIRASVR